MSPAESCSVLIVDDSPAMHKVLSDLLLRLGISDIEVAPSLPEALGKLRTRSYGLVISDSLVGEATGRELHAAMAASSDLAETPLILLTNQPERHGEGAQRFVLPKPFTQQSLRRKIENALAAYARPVAGVQA